METPQHLWAAFSTAGPFSGEKRCFVSCLILIYTYFFLSFCCVLLKSLAQLAHCCPHRHWRAAVRSHWSRLCSRLHKPTSLSLLSTGPTPAIAVFSAELMYQLSPPPEKWSKNFHKGRDSLFVRWYFKIEKSYQKYLRKKECSSLKNTTKKQP